jgi:hypothetical protein
MRFGCESATHLERRLSTIKWLGNGRHSSCTVYMVARFRPGRVGPTGTNVEPLQSGGRFLDALRSRIFRKKSSPYRVSILMLN